MKTAWMLALQKILEKENLQISTKQVCAASRTTQLWSCWRWHFAGGFQAQNSPKLFSGLSLSSGCYLDRLRSWLLEWGDFLGAARPTFGSAINVRRPVNGIDGRPVNGIVRRCCDAVGALAQRPVWARRCDRRQLCACTARVNVAGLVRTALQNTVAVRLILFKLDENEQKIPLYASNTEDIIHK